jgi:hypothetical protein
VCVKNTLKTAKTLFRGLWGESQAAARCVSKDFVAITVRDTSEYLFVLAYYNRMQRITRAALAMHNQPPVNNSDLMLQNRKQRMKAKSAQLIVFVCACVKAMYAYFLEPCVLNVLAYKILQKLSF